MKPLNMSARAHLIVEFEIIGYQLSVEADQRILTEIQYKLNFLFERLEDKFRS
jgi:hypothetical protein